MTQVWYLIDYKEQLSSNPLSSSALGVVMGSGQVLWVSIGLVQSLDYNSKQLHLKTGCTYLVEEIIGIEPEKKVQENLNFIEPKNLDAKNSANSSQSAADFAEGPLGQGDSSQVGMVPTDDLHSLDRGNTMQDSSDSGPELFARIQGSLQSDSFLESVEATLSGLDDDPELAEFLVDFVSSKVEYILSLLEPIEDGEEMAGMMSVAYIGVKAEWYMLNTKTQYTRGKDDEATKKAAYCGSLITRMIQAMEDFIDPATRRRVAEMLADPLEIAA